MKDEEISALFERNEAFCSMLAGIAKALEYGIRAVIVSHPDPNHLHAFWQAFLPEVAESHLTTEYPNAPMFAAGMQKTLATLSRQIELNAESRR